MASGVISLAAHCYTTGPSPEAIAISDLSVLPAIPLGVLVPSGL